MVGTRRILGGLNGELAGMGLAEDGTGLARDLLKTELA
jgi:hypothetical protein